jgi:hypothetical protein
MAKHLLLNFHPEQSQRFYVPSKPTIKVLQLAAAYASGIYFFRRVIVSKHWHTVEIGFLP